MKYNFLENMVYVVKEANRVKKKINLWLVCNFLSSLAIPLITTFISSFVVYLLTNGFSIGEYTLFLGLIVLALFILEAIKTYSDSKYMWNSTFIRCGSFWNTITKKTITDDFQKIEPKSGQKVISKAFYALDSNWVGIEGMMKMVPLFFINMVGMITYAIIVGIYSPYILIIFGVMSVFNYLITQRANKYLSDNMDNMDDIYREVTYLKKDTTDSIPGKDIRIYHMADWFDKIFVALTKKQVFFQGKYERKSLGAKLSDTIFLFIRDLIAYVTLITLVLNNSISVSTFVFLIGIVAGFSTWLNGFVEAINEMRKDNEAITNYRNYLDDTPKIKKNLISVSDLERPISVEFRDVSFTYPDTDKEIISHLSFKIEPGQKIAIVGNNGAGKTTMVKLMCGLYHPTSGKVLINGYDLESFNHDDYCKIISAVFQDSTPLAFTILENVACCPINEVNKDRFYKALKDANIYDKVMSLKDKEYTYISENFHPDGIRLSGGETQKLMLARALYKGGDLLLLDEPTSALDPLNEEKMYLTYHKFASKSTSVFISHRLSSTKFCDEIFFLSQGSIIERGTHDELMKRNGAYKEMFDIQAVYYKEEKENEEAI